MEVTQLGPYIEAYTLLQQEFQDPEFLAETGSEPEISPIINVAVIDTGVDPDSIKCFEICGASFVSSESGESPWWFSYHPHGTQMAKVITELNPFCRLLVAKVGDSVMDMTVDRVIQVYYTLLLTVIGKSPYVLTLLSLGSRMGNQIQSGRHLHQYRFLQT